MIDRYAHPKITEIWSDEAKVKRWQDTELAVILAREEAGEIPPETHPNIKVALEANPCDLRWWKQKDEELHHDLNAWLEERMRIIPRYLQTFFHQGLTSYDTEEPAFAIALRESVSIVRERALGLLEAFRSQALRYRFTPMNGRTHGQEAEIQSFGKRCLTWMKDVGSVTGGLFVAAEPATQLSKLSGAIGTYSGVTPAIEEKALAKLGLRPYIGATQIVPRTLHAPLASSLADLVTVLDKIATDFRLGARSGRPLWHEPFAKKQKGSSAMPHKKNTISTEKISGMARMARSYAAGIKENILTWEERAIDQSCIERVFWPDIFHVVLHALQTMDRVIRNMVVYPDNMLREIIASHGTYASNEAKEFLAAKGGFSGITREDAYRIVQLAAFLCFLPRGFDRGIRESPPSSLEKADELIEAQRRVDALGAAPPGNDDRSIQVIIREGRLCICDELDASRDQVHRWNVMLGRLFSDPSSQEAWDSLFKPSRALVREAFLFKAVLHIE